MGFIIDGRFIQDHYPGIGRYTYNLIRALGEVETAHRIQVLVNPALPNTRYDLQSLQAGPVELVPLKVPTVSWREQVVLPWLAVGGRWQLLHTPYFIGPYLLPCPWVVTIHDIASSRYPEFLPSWWARVAYEIATRLSLHRATLVLCDSVASREDLVHYFGASPAKVRVLYPGADEFGPSASPQEGPFAALCPYFLYVGIDKPHKNLVRLLRAYAKAQPPQRLVLAGPEDPRFPQARQEVEASGLQERVRFLGAVKEAELKSLYQQADAFLFPSLVEGFGLPMLEAMACGLPVMAANVSALPEVAGDAALFVNPLDVEEMAQAIRRLATDAALRSEFSHRALQRARRFTWKEAARQLLSLYEEAMTQR